MPQYAFELDSELCEAAESGNLLKVQRLVANGTDINERGFLNTTALMSAAQKGHNHVVAWLMTQPQCNPNLLNAGGTSALSLAARAGNLKAVMDICEHPATNINLLGGHGGTALHNAAGFGHSKVVAYLLALPNIEHPSTYTQAQYSAADIARKNGHNKIADVIDQHFAIQPTPSSSMTL